MCRLHAVLCDLVPGGVSRPIYASRAARILQQITPPDAVAAARCELAAAFLEDLRRIDAQIRETRTKLAAVVAATGTSLTGLLSRRGNRRLNHAIHMAAVTQVSHRHSDGRACYDKKLGEGKTPKEALRSLKRQISNAIFACLQAGARRAAARAKGPGGQQGNDSAACAALTPQAPALRTSHSRTWCPPYDPGRQPSARACQHPGQSWPFLDRCPPAVGDAAGPGGAPAAKRGRTTWRCGQTTAIPGREEGPGPRFPGKGTAPEGHLTRREKDQRNTLTQRGFRSARPRRSWPIPAQSVRIWVFCAPGSRPRTDDHRWACSVLIAYGLPARYLVGVPGRVMPLRFPSFSLGARDVRLTDVFRILKQGLDFFLYNASILG